MASSYSASTQKKIVTRCWKEGHGEGRVIDDFSKRGRGWMRACDSSKDVSGKWSK